MSVNVHFCGHDKLRPGWMSTELIIVDLAHGIQTIVQLVPDVGAATMEIADRIYSLFRVADLFCPSRIAFVP